jgi:hypothetical protein
MNKSIVEEAGWTSEPVCRLWRGEENHPCPESNPPIEWEKEGSQR